MGGKSASKRASRDAAAARADEQARQDRIRQGTQRVNTIFDGGVTTGGQVGAGTAFDPNATYYKADGSTWSPPSGAGAPPPSPLNFLTMRDGVSPISSFVSLATGGDPWGAAVKEGLYTTRTETDGSFGDAFFDGQRDRYINYAMPQVEEQKTAADKDLLFAMDRSGNTESSARADLSGELERRAGLQRQKVRDDGMNFSTQARNNVESSRNDLIAMLNATGDAEGAANSAMSRAAALSQPAAYSPVGNLFADFTGALGTQAAAERAFAFGGPRPTYNTGMFAPRTGAVSVT